jgi:WD40 repeat protein
MHMRQSQLAVLFAATVAAATVCAAQTTPKTPRADLRARAGAISELCFHPNGKFIASSHAADERIRIWDIASRRVIDTLEVRSAVMEGPTRRKTAVVERLLFTSDGSKLLAAYSDSLRPGGVQCWDIGPDGKAIGAPRALASDIPGMRALTLSPDSSRFAINEPNPETRGERIGIYDLQTGKLVDSLSEARLGVSFLAFIPGTESLISAGGGRAIQWDLTTGAQLRKVHSSREAITAMPVSADGKLLASGGMDDKVLVWELESATKKHEIKAESAGVTAVAFSPSGKSIVTGGVDGTIRVWSAVTGSQREVWRRHQKRPEAIAFAPDGKTVATAGQDEIVFLWDFSEPEKEDPPVVDIRDRSKNETASKKEPDK